MKKLPPIAIFAVLALAPLAAQTPNDSLVGCISRSDQKGIEKALSDGANPNLADANKKTVLMMAATFGQTESVRLLLKKGANPNLADEKGDTALMLACVNNRPEIIGLLIKGGADINAVNKKGDTCVTAALNKKHPEAARLVMTSEATPIFSPRLLSAAARSGDESLLELIKEKTFLADKDREAVDNELKKIRARKQKRAAAKQQKEGGIVEKHPALVLSAGAALALAAAGTVVLFVKRRRKHAE